VSINQHVLALEQTTNAVVQDPGPLETLSGAITWRDFSGPVGSLGLRSACAIPAVDSPWEGIADCAELVTFDAFFI